MTYRQFGSPLEGHPTPRFRYTEAATGSLGQGLSIGVGHGAERAGTSTGCRTGPMCCWATARWPKAPSGRPWRWRALRAGESHRDHRREPAGPARPDHVRLGPGRLPAPGGGVRLAGHRDRRARLHGDPEAYAQAAAGRRPPGDDHRPDDQGQGRSRQWRTRTTGTARRWIRPCSSRRSGARERPRPGRSPSRTRGDHRTARGRRAAGSRGRGGRRSAAARRRLSQGQAGGHSPRLRQRAGAALSEATRTSSPSTAR